MKELYDRAVAGDLAAIIEWEVRTGTIDVEGLSELCEPYGVDAKDEANMLAVIQILIETHTIPILSYGNPPNVA